MSSRVILIVVCCIFAACTAASAAGPVNGDFETGALAPWVSSYDPVLTYSVIVDPSNPANHIVQGVPGPDNGTWPYSTWLGNLAQGGFDISPSTEYTASRDSKTLGDKWIGWGVANYGESSFYEYNATGGVVAAHGVGADYTLHDWTTQSATFTTAATAAKGYWYWNGDLVDSQTAQAIYLDNFKLTATVPEPGSLVCLVSGLGLLGGLIRRRK